MAARRWWAFAVAAALCAWAPQAAAYCRITTCNPDDEDAKCKVVDMCSRTGAPISWAVSPIPYRFHGRPPAKMDAEEARGSIRLAFERWTHAVCPSGERTSLRFRELAEIPAATARGQQPFGIYFRDDRWPHSKATDTLALTTHKMGPSDGVIRYADIEVNTGGHKFSTRDDAGPPAVGPRDLEGVITHEIGHYIGLGHSPDAESIMVPEYCASKEVRCAKTRAFSRDLGADDVAAVCALYPPESAPLNDVAPVPKCSLDPAPSHAPFGFGVLAAVCAAALVRRRRRGTFDP
jgi:MYXO-CTERM domain-containing protein